MVCQHLLTLQWHGRRFSLAAVERLPRREGVYSHGSAVIDPLITSEVSTDRQLSRYVFFCSPSNSIINAWCSRISVHESQMPPWSYHGAQVLGVQLYEGSRAMGLSVCQHASFICSSFTPLHAIRSCLKINEYQRKEGPCNSKTHSVVYPRRRAGVRDRHLSFGAAPTIHAHCYELFGRTT